MTPVKTPVMKRRTADKTEQSALEVLTQESEHFLNSFTRQSLSDVQNQHMEGLLVLLLVFALAALFFAGEVLDGLPSMRLDSRRSACINVNRAVLRGDSAEVKKEMERVEKEAHAAFDARYGESQRSRSTRGEIHIGPKGGRYRINSKGRKSYDVP